MFRLRLAISRGRFSVMVVAAALLALAGCGQGLYQVRGKVVWEDGTEARELAGGMVVAESADGTIGARGDIEKDGSFQLSTYKPGDGLVPGKHRVAVVEYSPREPPPPPIIDQKFSSIETSGLQINVEPRSNQVTLKVRHATPQKRK